MNNKMYYCSNCQQYMLEETCFTCGGKTIINAPPRYSPQDHYGSYRQELKRQSKNNIKKQ